MDERGKNWNIGKDFSFRNQEDVSKAVEVKVRKEERQKCLLVTRDKLYSQLMFCTQSTISHVL